MGISYRRTARFEKVLLFILLFITAAAGIGTAQQNPFISSGKERENTVPDGGTGQPRSDTPEREQPRRTLQGLSFAKIAALQRKLYSSITHAVESFQDDRSPGVFLTLLGIMFLYGFIHAVGPGHRKIILTSYFLSESIRPLPGIFMAAGVAVFHGVSALAIIGLLYFVLDATISGSFNSASLLIEQISYGILVLLGIYLVVHTVRESKKTVRHAHDDAVQPSRRGNAGRVLFVVSNGIVPCPGAALVLVFTFTYGLYTVGILSVLAMSLGMGLLLSLVSGAVIVGKEKGLKRVFSGRRGTAVLRIIEIGGGAAVIAFGVLLLLGSL